MLLRRIVGDKVPPNRVFRSRPESAASALVVSRIITEPGIGYRRQTIGRDKLPFSRRETISVPFHSAAPLIRRSPRLSDARRERTLKIVSRPGQCFCQINALPLLRSQRLRSSVLRHERAGEPSLLPVTQLLQALLGCGFGG